MSPSEEQMQTTEQNAIQLNNPQPLWSNNDMETSTSDEPIQNNAPPMNSSIPQSVSAWNYNSVDTTDTMTSLIQSLSIDEQTSTASMTPSLSWNVDAPSFTPSSSSSSSMVAGGSSAENMLEKPFCLYCKENGWSKRCYESHTLKTDEGCVICPVLRNTVCALCGATGDTAHTEMYCEVFKSFLEKYGDI